MLVVAIMALFCIGELYKSKGRIILKFDSSIAESSLSQCWVAVIMFVMVFDGLLALNRLASTSNDSTRIFSDMVSPTTMRNAAYVDNKDTITLCNSVFVDPDDTIGWTGIQCVNKDTLNVIVSTVQEAKHNADTKSWRSLLPVLVYMLGLVVFSGVLVATINRMFAMRVERYRQGLTHYQFKNHIVIVGAGNITISLVKSLLNRNDSSDQTWMNKKRKQLPQVVIMTRENVVKFRKQLFSCIDEKRHDCILVQYGEQTSLSDMRNVHVGKAKEIYVMGDYDNTDYSCHDADNITSLKLIKELVSGSPEPVDCHVMFEYQSASPAFQFSDMSNEIGKVLNFVPFNLYEMMAQNALVNRHLEGKKNEIQALEGEGIDFQSEKHVHLVILGMTSMGTAMAMEAAQLCHYPNFIRNKKLKTRITFIDEEADREMRFLMGRYRDLFSICPWRYIEVDKDAEDYHATKDFDHVAWNKMREDLYDKTALGEDFMDVEWEFIKGGIEMAEVQSYLRFASLDTDEILTVAVCLNETHRNVAAALYLPTEVYEKGLQVLVYQSENDSIVEMLQNTKPKEKWSERYTKLYSFGCEKEGMDLAYFDSSLAQYVNYVYSTVQYDAEDVCGNADYSLAKTKENSRVITEEWEREVNNGKSKSANRWSSRYSANSLWTKLRSVAWKGGREMTEEEVEQLSEVEHNRWNIEQLIANFRPMRLGEERRKVSEMKKERVHPDLKDFSKLKEDTKKYDRAIVRAMPYLYEKWEKAERNRKFRRRIPFG